MLDFETLTKPVSADDPCGPDLDSEGNVQYLNFFAGAETMLPVSYFDVVKPTGERGRFDPKAFDFEAQFAAAAPLLARTRDLRLTVLLAKLSILNRDLPSFSACLRGIAFLLGEQWETVHPRGEDGDFSYRGVTIESIDVLPTVVNPLQFLPLIENRRHGIVTFRTYQIAKGEFSSTGGDGELDLATIERILNETDLDILKNIHVSFSELVAAIAAIKRTWQEKSGSPQPLNFDKLSGVVEAIVGWLREVTRNRDPAAVEADPGAASESGEQVSDSAQPAADFPKITSSAVAAKALTAVAGYFTRSEPSSPALLLVRQAMEMVGKSFVEAVRMLVPAHAEAAAVNIGRDWLFDLPIEQMASLDNSGLPSPADGNQDQDVVFTVESRTQALFLLGQVANYFRASEPASPIPLLTDRARELAQRDFISLLHDVLPEGALKMPTER